MSYIDESYFINDISIPNLGNDRVIANLDSALNKYEREALISILGYELYDLMNADDSSVRFQEIINGADFTFSFEGKTIKRKWLGLANTDKESLIAYYTYYYYVKNRNTIFSGIGNITPDAESADQSTPMLKLVTAYNAYIRIRGNVFKQERNVSKFELNNLYVNYLYQNTYKFYNTYPSLYNFLLANLSTYPEWVFIPDEKINEFNL